MGILKHARRPQGTAFGEIAISVSSAFVRGSVRDSGSRDGRNVELTAYVSKSGNPGKFWSMVNAVIPTMGSEADSAGARGGAVRCKARRTDASSTPGRTIDRNGTDDEDFEDTPELSPWSCPRANVEEAVAVWSHARSWR